MKSQCPQCKDVFEVPAEYRDKQVNCRTCQKPFVARPFKKPPIVIPTALPASRNFVTKLWTNTPAPFKTAFFATLGVISAILLTIFAYGRLLPRYTVSQIEQAKIDMGAYKLFPASRLGLPGIMRGRHLTEYKFLPDATYRFTYLSLWTDELSMIAGITAIWIGGYKGSPAAIEDDVIELSRGTAVCRAFTHLTTFDVTGFPIEAFAPAEDEPEGSEIYTAAVDNWWIVVFRIPVAVQPAGHYYDTPIAPNKGSPLYRYTATAQNW